MFVNEWKEWSNELKTYSADFLVNEAVSRVYAEYMDTNQEDTCAFVVLPGYIEARVYSGSFDVVRKADKIAVDQVGQSLHRGNVKELAEMGEITEDSFDIIIPDVLAGKAEARTNHKDRIYAQIIGTGMLDVACAGLLLQKIEASGEELFRFDMTK